jgi:hypothetical protein
MPRPSQEAMSELLSTAELEDLTDTKVRDKQEEALTGMGIPYIRRGKEIKVSRELMRQRMLGQDLKQSQGPNWSAVR